MGQVLYRHRLVSPSGREWEGRGVWGVARKAVRGPFSRRDRGGMSVEDEVGSMTQADGGIRYLHEGDEGPEPEGCEEMLS